MNKKILNKKFLFFSLVLLSSIATVFISSKIKNNSSVTSNVPTSLSFSNQIDYQKIIPGVSLKKDVVSLLGDPLNEEGNTIEYKSSSPNFNHQITFDQEKVSFVKEIVTLKEKDSKKGQDVIKAYGEPKAMLYGPDAEAGFFLFVYPEDGVAYIGHPESGLLLEIWHFPSTNLESFINKYAQDYSKTRQFRQ